MGITYSKGSTANSRTVSEQLPSRLVASGASTASGWNTLLQGTVFQTNLSGANITAGVGPNARADAQIILEGIKKTVTESRTKESNYVVWQRQLGAGSTVETMTLPSFSGPQRPVFNAPGGLMVQVPTGELRTQIQTLSQQPGMGYLTELSQRSDVDWQPVKLAYEQWNYKQEGLTPAGAALLSVAVAWATGGGMGADLLGQALGTNLTGASALAANAAFTSLAAQASITFVNNKGNIGKTLSDLAKSDIVKATIAAALTAGALGHVNALPSMQGLNLGDPWATKLAHNLIIAGGRALVNTAINGGSLEDALKQALVGGLVDTAQGHVASLIKAEGFDYLAHKLAHALAGCVAGAAAGGECRDGAIGAAVGEVVAEMFDGQKPGTGATPAQVEAFRQKVLATSKIVAGTVAAYAGGNAQTAITTAEVAVTNNYLSDKQWKEFSDKLAACKGDKACEANVQRDYLLLSQKQDAHLAMCDARGGCSSLRTDVFEGRQAMLDLVNNGKLPVGYAGALDMQYMGQRLATDSTFRKQVGNAVNYMNWCTTNATACNKDQLQKAAGLSVLVLGPVIVANPQLVAAILFAQNGQRGGAAVAAGGANALAQGLSSGQINPEDVLKAAATAYATAGASLATTMAVNVGAEGVVRWARDEQASEVLRGMLLSAAGTAVGFKVGDLTKGAVGNMATAFHQSTLRSPVGTPSILMPVWLSAAPSTAANIGNSAASEAATWKAGQLIAVVRSDGVK